MGHVPIIVFTGKNEVHTSVNCMRFKAHIQEQGTNTSSWTVPENKVLDQKYFQNVEPLPTLEEAMENLMLEALQRSGNNRSLAAKWLGISRQRLARQLKAKKSTSNSSSDL